MHEGYCSTVWIARVVLPTRRERACPRVVKSRPSKYTRKMPVSSQLTGISAMRGFFSSAVQHLERLTKRVQLTHTDDTARQGKQRDMNVDTTLEAGAQLAKGRQPGMCALDHPAMTTQPVIALDAAPRDTALNASTFEVSTAPREVIALVRVQLAWPTTRSPWFATHRRQQIDQLLEDHRVMPVGPSDTEGQWNASSVRDDMALAAKLAPVSGVGAGVQTPRGLGTLPPSKQARLKSSLSALRSSANSFRCKLCHTPAACQSRSRLQQVMPLPKPNSWGSSSHGIPVRSTKTMPFKANSSLKRGRPPLSEGVTTGNNGSIRWYSAELISRFRLRFMHRQTHITSLPMTCFVSRS